MLVKAVIIVLLLVIVYTLASSFFFMLKDKGGKDRMLTRLTWRIGLSLSLLLVIYIMFLLGWIEPSSGPVNYRG